MGKCKPFLEILSSSLHGDYKFPILEFLAFLFLLSSFVFTSFGFSSTEISEEYFVYRMASSLTGLPLFIFAMLLFKNIASGIGNDLEKDTMQTLLAYPLKRRSILTAKLISAFAVATLLFLGMQFSALYLLAPDMVTLHLQVVLLTYVAYMSLPLLVASITLLLTLIFKKGTLASVIGIMLFFLFSTLSSLMSLVAYATDSLLPLQLFSLLVPNIAIDSYYSSLQPMANIFWRPSIFEALLYCGAGYCFIAVILSLSYFYFSRRLNT